MSDADKNNAKATTPSSGTETGETQHKDVKTGADDAAGAREHGGPKGPEPTRYGDWEVKGRCSDF